MLLVKFLTSKEISAIKGMPKPKVKIKPKYAKAAKEAFKGLPVVEAVNEVVEANIPTAYDSLQYHINSLDWQIKSLMHRGNVLSFKMNDKELTIVLSTKYRITMRLNGQVKIPKGKGKTIKVWKHHYTIKNNEGKYIFDETVLPNPRKPEEDDSRNATK